MKNALLKTLVGAALLTAVSLPAFADDLPPLPNDQWYYEAGTPVVTTDTVVTTNDFNRAAIASGGKASSKNQSNFQTTTTTVIQTTTTPEAAINPGGQNVESKDTTLVTVEVLSTETSDPVHIKPSKH